MGPKKEISTKWSIKKKNTKPLKYPKIAFKIEDKRKHTLRRDSKYTIKRKACASVSSETPPRTLSDASPQSDGPSHRFGSSNRLKMSFPGYWQISRLGQRRQKLGFGRLNGSEDKETFNGMSKGHSSQIAGAPSGWRNDNLNIKKNGRLYLADYWTRKYQKNLSFPPFERLLNQFLNLKIDN